jgi:hypothetical protein
MIGGTTVDAPLDVLLNEAPLWRRVQEPSTEVFHDRNVWEGFPTAEKRLIMVRTMSLAPFLAVHRAITPASN